MMKFSKPLHRLKSDAKALAKGKGIALNQAQDIIALSEGFNGWSHMASEWSKAAMSQFDNYVENEREDFRLKEEIGWPEVTYQGGEAPCPFCGETEALSLELGEREGSVCCDNCGAKSPDAQSEGEAYRVWELRTKSRNPNACPFCGEVAEVTPDTSQVHCRKCGAQGPAFDLVEEDDDFPEKDAVSLWQLRGPARD